MKNCMYLRSFVKQNSIFYKDGLNFKEARFKDIFSAFVNTINDVRFLKDSRLKACNKMDKTRIRKKNFISTTSQKQIAKTNIIIFRFEKPIK